MEEKSEDLLSALEKASKNMMEVKESREPDDYSTQVDNEQDESFLFEKQPEESKVSRLRRAWKHMREVSSYITSSIEINQKLDKNLRIDSLLHKKG